MRDKLILYLLIALDAILVVAIVLARLLTPHEEPDSDRAPAPRSTEVGETLRQPSAPER